MSADSDWLPPGQVATRKFPVVGERRPAAPEDGVWRLDLVGLVERPRSWTVEGLRSRPGEERTTDIHCVTGWSRRRTRWTGFPLARLLEEAGPKPEARFVRFVAWSEHDHETSLPLDLALEDTWVVWARDGEALAVEHGGPLRTITPSRYFYKSIKWLRRIELMAEERLGTWERESSYHPVGDPWAGDQRFSSGSLSPERLEAFRSARSLVPWRGPRRVMIGLDLGGWAPKTRELGDLHLKSCDLRKASLAGADLRGANLSLSDLRAADLRGADLRGADLEGVDLRRADLRGADLRGAALTASRFVDAGAVGARVEGIRWSSEAGLLEEQEEYLLGNAGVSPEPSADGPAKG